MVSISGAFPTKYIAAADLQGQERPVTISHVVMEQVGQGAQQDTLPVVYFQGQEKGLVLNKTNAATISGLHGDETDMWANKSIILFPTQTDYQGRQVACIRVKLVSIPAQPPVPTGAPMGAGEIDDTIPFAPETR